MWVLRSYSHVVTGTGGDTHIALLGNKSERLSLVYVCAYVCGLLGGDGQVY